MTFLEKQLAALKAAGAADKQVAKATSGPHVKRFIAYGELNGREYAIGWRLNAIEAASIIALAKRRLIRRNLLNEDGKPLFELSTFFTREEKEETIWKA